MSTFIVLLLVLALLALSVRHIFKKGAGCGCGPGGCAPGGCAHCAGGQAAPGQAPRRGA